MPETVTKQFGQISKMDYVIEPEEYCSHFKSLSAWLHPNREEISSTAYIVVCWTKQSKRVGRQQIPFLKRRTDLEQRFRKHADQWYEDTAVSSSFTDMVMHQSYQGIIGMGPKAVPMLLKELRTRPAHWFWALRSITGENPVADEDAGRLLRMRDAWLDWGKRRGLI